MRKKLKQITNSKLILTSFVVAIFMGFISIYLFSYDKSRRVQFEFDIQRRCDLAKIQYGLEIYFAQNMTYPSSLFDKHFKKLYDSKFPNNKDTFLDPQLKSSYEYSVGNTTRYRLRVKLSQNTELMKDSSNDFPGKNAGILKGLEVPVDKSTYEIPCSMLEKEE
ncbi:MAG: hypothetical protein WCO06_01105 [Candidatus Roizmanbacteria bacterium]